jgi:hypothetical protein
VPALLDFHSAECGRTRSHTHPNRNLHAPAGVRSRRYLGAPPGSLMRWCAVGASTSGRSTTRVSGNAGSIRKCPGAGHEDRSRELPITNGWGC